MTNRERNIEASKRPVVRYVVTHRGKDGLRTLIGAAQGRNTYETRGQAQAQLYAILKSNNREMLEKLYGFPLEVRPCDCWPGHFDPMGVYFDEEEDK